ncbi:protein sprint isoform X3 [Pectinophora gossypiella]|uniref:protein sprint isoform X3 n=1 Tax=Pectinophora gossypiella TaxID=13191 RepID=UPI00214E140F|nr:protein sprint isoform X3 [Pectinophora gossypiella]XP_049874834.1 protein sprint isoform X3 [Pectinophora gossypiella]XP_049874835.1 protein sprint isoform X3 [Pectinophora gossypiella]XP_049874836.1 protein sprint isoform X3 [Pectinophora gossypiella]XP_049874837.1 protein sprint isoform X3 [Pectinophora gossypiella]
MLITKYTAILLESARTTEARNTALRSGDGSGWSSSLDSASSGQRRWRRRQFAYRSATFLEPHLQGVRRRDSRSSDSDHDERSTEDDERSLLRCSPRTRLPPPPPPPPDDEPPPLKPREFFERLQSQAMREAQERKRPRDLPLKENQLFRPVDAEGSLGDSLSQSRESLSSDGEGARGDCSSVGSSGSGSEEQPPCDIGLLERLIRTHPVWFLPGIQRAGAFHLLQGKEEGNFVVRQSSQPDTMAISVRLPADKGPYIEHYLIQASGGRIGLETSHNRFDNIPELIAHYSQCCDELPVQLQLPRPLREAKSRHQLSSLALLGQEFWGYPMANPKNNPQNLISPCQQLVNGVVPMAVTPSDTGSSLSSFNASSGNISRDHILSPDKDQNVVLKMSPIESSGSPPSQTQSLSTFKGRTAPSPPAKPSGTFIRAPRPTPPNTLNLMTSTAHITQPHSFPTTNTQHSPTLSSVKSTPPPPPPRWAKPPTKASLSPKSEVVAFSPINKASQNGNITVTTTVTFSVNNTQIHNHQINESIQSDRLQLTLASNTINNNNCSDSVFSVTDATKTFADANEEQQSLMHRMSPEGECINAMTSSLHGSFKRQVIEQNSTEIGSPNEPQSQTNTSESADPIVNSYTKSSNSFGPNQIVSPNGTNSVTSGIFSPTSQINSPVSNDTISSKSGVFSPLSQTNKSEIFSPVSRSSPISGKSVFSPSSNQSIVSPMMGKDREKILSPNTNTTSTTPSGRSRRSRHSQRKESRHYQESDILESPGVYYRSSLMDKVSDYEDIWGPEGNNCSTFKPSKMETDNNISNGLMKSKRPDLLPDTLPKLNAAKSTQSILEKENMIILNSTESLNEKKNLSDSSLKKSFNGSTEIIATTNSKGEIIPKRPDKLNIAMNMNKKLTEEIEASFKNREVHNNTESMETVKLEDCIKDPVDDDSEKDNAGSPFYADPVDAIKEAALPPVQRRKLLRVGMSLAQRYSEPPNQNHPYYPLRDMHSIEELSPSSPNTSTSVDNLVSLRSKPKMKPVQPPRVANKPPTGKNDQTWTVDSSWEFINKNDEGSNSESGTFPSLAEQESRLSGVDDGTQHLTVHQIVAQRFPELHLNAEPVALPEEVRSPPRASCYDNVHDLRPLSEQASDDGTVFSEPWDSSQWDGLLPPSNGQQSYDMDEPCEWESPIPRRGPAAATRAKSFRDRLDPLLAAGRVRALRGGRTSRGAGAALRAYALHLAQDKSTTFAQNVDNFISCTLDSKETCPQVMMRNMRQFMSGMKNYLVKHGEREFEKEVEKERLKLKPTEFLNLDAILEGVMHRLVVRPLRSKLYSLLASWHSADVRRLHAAIERAQHATPLQLGIKESTKVPSTAVLAVISKHFLKMQEADSPLDKLENLLAAISVMFNSIRGERALGADDLLPVLAWTVARCRLVCAELEAELMAGLLPAALLAGEGGYYLTALFSAVAVLKRLAPEPGPDSTTPWRRGSLEANRDGCPVAVVRVALPDECRGSIRRVALPCRPGARARDLCRALAHAAAITNPQDYALFALHDGHETMLNENDCPQEVMTEMKSGQNFILAYKRIDAKIAWPQQALLSYP